MSIVQLQHKPKCQIKDNLVALTTAEAHSPTASLKVTNMAHITHSGLGHLGIADRFWGAFDAVKAAYIRNRDFAHTFNELNALSDRELMDLGITKADIAAIARGETVERVSR